MVGKQDDPTTEIITDPVRELDFTPNLQNDGTSFVEKAEVRGTIFIYQINNDDPSRGILNY